MYASGTVSSERKVLFHVTTTYRATLIAARGVDPEKATGRLKSSWWVSPAKLAWAIGHVSVRHDVPATRIMVVAHAFDSEHQIINWMLPGIFRCPHTVYVNPAFMFSARKALKAINEDWHVVLHTPKQCVEFWDIPF